MYKSTLLFALLAVFALCVGLSAASMPSRSRYNTERVYDFRVSDAKDEASWRAFGRQWTVRLYLSDVTEDNSDYFFGSLVGDDSAAVSFALLPGTGLSGMIATSNQTWWITARPVEENGNSEEEAQLGVFMFREPLAEMSADANLPLPSFGEPVEPEVDEETETETAAASREVRAVTNYKVSVNFDQKWAQASNNPWSSQADTLALMNEVNAIYKAAGLATFTVVYGKQITNPQTGLQSMLSYFAGTVAKGALKTLMADRTYTNYIWLVGSNVGGLAYVGSSCRATGAQSQKTGVIGLTNYSRLWQVKAIAHELGHNRGASHEFDNQCKSGITKNCQCSVMSYCFPSASNNPNGAKNLFSTYSINQMKSKGCY